MLGDQEPVATAIVLYALADGWDGKPLGGDGRTLVEQPGRQDGRHHADAGRVAGRVARHVEAAPPRGVNLVHHAPPRARRRAAPREVVGELEAGAGLLADADDLGDGLLELLVAGALVAGMHPPGAGHDAAHRRQLLGRGRASRHVFQAGREAERALVERLRHQTLHVGDGVESGRFLVVAHHGAADGPVTDEHGDVSAQAAGRQCVQILAERAPGDRGARRGAGQVGADALAVVGRERGVAEAAVAQDFGGHAQPDGAVAGAVGQDAPVAMRVAVNEAGGDDLPRHVNDAPGGGAGQVADGDDAVVLDGNVTGHPGRTAAVHQPATAQQYVEHCVFSVASLWSAKNGSP